MQLANLAALRESLCVRYVVQRLWEGKTHVAEELADIVLAHRCRTDSKDSRMLAVPAYRSVRITLPTES